MELKLIKENIDLLEKVVSELSLNEVDLVNHTRSMIKKLKDMVVLCPNCGNELIKERTMAYCNLKCYMEYNE